MASVRLAPPAVRCEVRRDGSVIVESADALAPYRPRIMDLVLHWASAASERVALADRRGPDGAWRTLTYAGLAAQTAALGQSLLDGGLGAERPLMIVSQNSIEAAVATLAAYRAGVPVSPVTPAYSAGAGDPSRLSDIAATLKPGMVLVDEPGLHEASLRALLPPDVKLASFVTGGPLWTPLHELLERHPAESLAAASASVTADTVAKILFTSGSTGTPKGAINTHRMLSANLQALRQAWPFTADAPPILVDWLPWNHTFGGNFVLNLVLGTGGTLYIDDGRPLPGQIQRSIDNAAEVGPTLHLNAPRGLDMVARVLSAQPELAARFFSRLRLVFFASAGLPTRIRDEWRRLIDRHATGPVAFCSAWGATETAPLATILNFEAAEINNIGVPVAGTTVKLAPVDGRFELRVKGPNVTPGYLRRDDLSAGLFDEEGFLRTGDAGRLANPEDPSAGLLIEGRLAEDFKLSTGIWVNVSGLRAQLLETAGHIVRDIVLSGPNRDELAALLFMDLEQCSALAARKLEWSDLPGDPAIAARVQAAISQHNAAHPTSSRRIARFRIMGRPLEAAAGEVTEKGTVSQSAVLRREAKLCGELHETRAPAPVGSQTA